MMYDLHIAWRNILNRPIQTIVPVWVVALAIALSVAVIALADGAEQGVVDASDPFGVLVIGSAGSGQQLVLSSVLLQGNPIGNIPYDVYESLEADPRIQLTVPLAFGDNVGGSRIIGTNENFFQLRRTQSSPPAFQIAQGRLFAEIEPDHEESEYQNEEDHHKGLYEAVLGAEAARRLKLTIGDRFLGTHGVGTGIAENIHAENPYTVVGILERTNTAYDAAVYTQLESVWHVHAHPDIPGSALIAESGASGQADEITAILVLPTGFIEQNQIVQEFYVDPTMQAAFPGQELGQLLQMLNQGQQILNIVGYLVLAIAGLTLFLSMYNAILTRRQSIAIMRSLGSSRANIFRVVIFETLIVSILGALIGRVLGYGLAYLIAEIFSQQSSIPVVIRILPNLEVLLWTLSLGVGLLAGVVPAMMAYRVNVVENLFPS
ncbi:ABC transporter permease [Phototrophicus methaneseepsis]|uniref:ABC transporter permease n=1 Tax=Phototrophicus methaneseepsis TaxID=2710758 RepID=A0A7S8E6I5_9CHLR|nr:FtsX-like permease family protein [Phototrophicus methaneseepsis]QPC81265.1 ABC transporter permease [Phototrophicus methaneseepsis]